MIILGVSARCGIFAAAITGLAACVGSEAAPQSNDAGGDGNATAQDGAPDSTSGGPDATTIPDSGADGMVVQSNDSGGAGGCATEPCVIATGLNHPFMMTSDANRVYWTEYGDTNGSENGAVKGCPLSGCGSAPIVYAQGLLNPAGVAVDATNIYYTTSSYSSATGGIWSCPLTGCTTPKRLTTAGIPMGIAVDSEYVYWVDNDDGSVHRVLKGSGADVVLYDAASDIVFEPQNCAIDKSFVYVTDEQEDLYRVPLGGGEPITMFTGALGGQEFPVAVVDPFVYFGQPGQIMRMLDTGVDGGGAIAFANGPLSPTGLAIDPSTDTLYWSDYGNTGTDGTLGKISLDGGGQTNLGASLVSPFAVTVSGPYLFWLDNGVPGDGGEDIPGTGALYRRSK